MTEASSSPKAPHRLSTGEFSDDAENEIPLHDIRQAEFARLENLKAPKATSEPQDPWWRRLLRFGRSQSSAQYAKVDDESGAAYSNLKKGSSDGKKSDWTCGKRLGWSIFAFLVIANILVLLASAMTGRVPNPLSRWGDPNTSSEGLSWYPTDFLRDVQPIPCHSHNDYWRDVPLFSALYAGCESVEADIWLYPNTDSLLVGHSTASLTSNRTFKSLYVDPLVKILQDKNQDTPFNNASATMNGVFDVDAEQSLTLLVDLKTDSVLTWNEMQAQLQPLRDHGWLTFVQNDVVHKRPITVVGTGNTRFDVLMQNATYRDVFFDAPLDRVAGTDTASNAKEGQGNEGTSPDDSYTSLNSYYASASLKATVGATGPFPMGANYLTPKNKELIRSQIKAARSVGLKARYWEAPGWPQRVKQEVWRFLWEEGAGVLNVDDLEGVKNQEW